MGKLLLVLLLGELKQEINEQFNTKMGRQTFTPKKTAIGWNVLLEIPRNHLECIAYWWYLPCKSN